jgi:hypothetical protein
VGEMNGLLSKSQVFIKRHGSFILTCMGGAGVIATAVTAVKATPKALVLLEQAKEEKGDELTVVDKTLAAGPAYIPSVLIGAGTIACIFGANVLNKRQQAALVSAYALMENSYKEYKKKVEELYGEGSNRTVLNEIAKDHYNEEEFEDEPDDGLELFYDEFSGRYFRSTMIDVLKAEYELNRILAQDVGAYLNDFYKLLGLAEVDYGNYMGWSTYELVETYCYCWVEFLHTNVKMEDGMECCIITIQKDPIFDFENY